VSRTRSARNRQSKQRVPRSPRPPLRREAGAGRSEIDGLTASGALREDVDRLWTTLQHFFLIWAPLSFMPLLTEILGGPLLEERNLDRWVGANVELLGKGVYR